MTCLRSRDSALTLLPTSPEWSTNDLGLPSPVGFAPSLLFCVRVLLYVCPFVVGCSESARIKRSRVKAIAIPFEPLYEISSNVVVVRSKVMQRLAEFTLKSSVCEDDREMQNSITSIFADKTRTCINSHYFQRVHSPSRPYYLDLASSQSCSCSSNSLERVYIQQGPVCRWTVSMGQEDVEPIPRADKGKGRATEPHQQEEPGIVDDLIAGWIGGAVGILASSSFFKSVAWAWMPQYIVLTDILSCR